MADSRIIKRFRKSSHDKRPSCAKHGPYNGPYCQACYEKAMDSINANEPEGTRDS